MSDRQFKITFIPQHRTVYVLAGTRIIEAAALAGLTVITPCGSEGTCGKCRVKVTKGAAEPSAECRKVFTAAELTAGWRLACQTGISTETIVEAPQTSLTAAAHQILTDSPIATDLIDIAPSGKTGNYFGIAFDIGTTTIVGALLDLKTGTELAIDAQMNPQIAFGDDVLSRIKHCSAGPEYLTQLHDLLIAEIAKMIETMCDSAGISADDIYEMTVSGNTTMQHIFSQLDPTPLGSLPFTPGCLTSLHLTATELCIPINPKGKIYVFPVIGGFVGGDTVSCILASDLENQTAPALMVDIGTNGEIVLVVDGKIFVASTAAGPALEGARISAGMRATNGAIEKILFTDDVHHSVIGNTAPTGICGSGLIDLTAELLKAKIISNTGRLLNAADTPDDLPPAIKQRIQTATNGQTEFVVSDESDTLVTLTSADVRELQLAIGAIRACIVILLKTAGVEIDDLEHVFIAGGFGSFIRRANAQTIGLLPADIPHHKISYIGNASLAGAKHALLSLEAQKKAEQIAKTATHTELSLDPNFQMQFAESMIFPD